VDGGSNQLFWFCYHQCLHAARQIKHVNFGSSVVNKHQAIRPQLQSNWNHLLFWWVISAQWKCWLNLLYWILSCPIHHCLAFEYLEVHKCFVLENQRKHMEIASNCAVCYWHTLFLFFTWNTFKLCQIHFWFRLIIESAWYMKFLCH
jgi:hypothetical protein